MRAFMWMLSGLPLILGGCSEKSAMRTKQQSQPPKPMIESREYESMDEFLNDKGNGFVILHQERAPGSDYREKEDSTSPVLARKFSHFLAELSNRLGKPDEQATEWHLGIPTWASGCGYALWKRQHDFVSLFISWDNPEDPGFVIAARAPLSHFDPTPGMLDPWDAEWMSKGQW